MPQEPEPARSTVTLGDIAAAADRLAGHILRTPTIAAPALCDRFGCTLALKLETLQRTGSFKERGALNKLAQLSAAQARAGVIGASAGNHAQSLAYHAQRLGVPAVIVMPAATPSVKVERTARWGARIELEGADLSQAEAAAQRIADAEGFTVVHPYDDAAVIAGQGTIGLEMLADRPDLDLLIVPVGGGGLIAGVATAAKALKPGITVIGVQVAGYSMMAEALGWRRPPAAPDVHLQRTATLAEGIAVKRPGRITRAIIAATVDELVTVSETAIEQAVELLVEHQNLVTEGAGAAGVAALIEHGARWRGRTIGIVLCGGNIDARMIASIMMRGLVRDGRLVRIHAEIDDAPGQLARLANIVGAAGGNIIEIEHQRLSLDLPIKNTGVDMVIETRNPEHVREILAALAAGGFFAQLRHAEDWRSNL